MPTPTIYECKEFLNQGAGEIERLRQENAVLGAQVFVIETFAKALDAQPRSHGAGEDLAWRMRQMARAIEVPKPPSAPPTPESPR